MVNFIKGLVIGLATLVPGVSGGTIAMILGIYSDLIHSIGSFFKDIKRNIILLLQVGIGAILGIVLFSKIINLALNRFPYQMSYLFMGVVSGGFPLLYKKSLDSKVKRFDFVFFIVGFIVVYIMTLEPNAIVNLAMDTGIKNIIFLIVAGIVIAIALIMPGISTSFMLLTLGLYDFTLEAINQHNLNYLIPLCIGVVIGTAITTKTIEKLLNKHTSKTYLLIVGFVVGSLIEIFPGIPEGMDLIYSIIIFSIGFLLINKISSKQL